VKLQRNIEPPNAFTPNGDGIHDVWEIAYLSDYMNVVVDVFNRYGQNVYHVQGYGSPWDGRMNGKDLPAGTYYYIINLGNGGAPLSGPVTIIR
jgi:gliding motility-associated-like protein